jgi:hypothetical protein
VGNHPTRLETWTKRTENGWRWLARTKLISADRTVLHRRRVFQVFDRAGSFRLSDSERDDVSFKYLIGLEVFDFLTVNGSSQ